MPNYDLGTLTIIDHDVEKLTDALGIPDHRFEDLVENAQKAYDYEDTISESIEWLADNLSGSELVLGLVFFGRIWEQRSEEQ
jgi:GH18 family chitinase